MRQIKNLKGQEIVYAFAGYLSGQKGLLKTGSKYNAAPLAELVAKFCEANNLPAPRTGWEKANIWPEAKK